MLKQGRVLAAYAKGGTIYPPLRSMFEAMGATVSFDASGRVATITKAGATTVVTVGKPEVIINGQSRPPDVPPMIYHGVVLVPVRVDLREHGRLRAMGSRPAFSRRPLHSGNAADGGSGSAAGAGRNGCSAAAASADAQSAQAGRLRPFVLLHASERFE